MSNLVFREDNTEGYDRNQLAWLNSHWDVSYSDIDPDSDEGKRLQERLFEDLEAALGAAWLVKMQKRAEQDT